MDNWPPHLRTDRNRLVLERLDGTSAHGDLSEFFLAVMTDNTQAKIFSVKNRPYSYYFAYANDVIFGFCTSMTSISIVLPEHLHADALADGGELCSAALQTGWFDFPAWGENKPDHALWAQRAYAHAMG